MKFDKFSKVFQIGLVAISSAFVMPLTYAQDAGTRVAVVNSEKVFNESNFAKAMQTRLQNEFTKRQNDLRDSAEKICLLYTSPSPRDGLLSRMPSSA